MPASATRLVSMHDPDARPIAKGRLGKPVEFGYKAQVVDNVDGIVLDHSVHQGNPPDAPLLVPAIGRIQTLFGRLVRAVTADRGYGEAKIEQELCDLGVKTMVIPRKGKPSAARRELEHGRGFRRLVKWRTGCEGRISYLKRRYGFDGQLRVPRHPVGGGVPQVVQRPVGAQRAGGPAEHRSRRVIGQRPERAAPGPPQRIIAPGRHRLVVPGLVEPQPHERIR